MADNDQPSRLEAATVKAEAGSQIVSDFANLPAGQTVATASGNIPTLAGVIGVIQDEGDQAAADVRAKADAQVQAAIGTLVKKDGDTMTGALTLSGPPTANLHAATKQYADNIPRAFTKYFESTQQSIVALTRSSIVHGLGGVPKFISAHLVCTAANLGFAVGDRVEVSTSLGTLDQNGNDFTSGFAISANATSIDILHASFTPLIGANPPINNRPVNLLADRNSWKLVVRAAL